MCRLAAVATAGADAADEDEAAAAADEDLAELDADDETAPLEAAAADAYFGAPFFQCGTGFFAASDATPPSSKLASDTAPLPPAAPIPSAMPSAATPATPTAPELRPEAEAEAAAFAWASRAR
jgi:hypothetical protein